MSETTSNSGFKKNIAKSYYIFFLFATTKLHPAELTVVLPLLFTSLI